ncbi:DUF4418 family protein [Heliophilum fasciatum]|uniref:Uncharacterized protein DUF4418 n=1 Tax=Heliophilum fasciatum TaxID=35700 RepID=A0A4R2RPB2_9FIRM|nr:DUF4418 family protein [Heliophilum fasciatum]MCW2277706.1 hypothetical protein [Heliophilum fasciatum]TCP65053.1 uncharacterized protein DUF4418 [Heliophilum fasciatum]
MKSRWNYFGYAAIFFSLALLVTPKIVPICRELVITQSGSAIPMRCHYAYQAAFLISLFALLIAGSLLVVKEQVGQRILGLLLAISGLVIFLIPQSWLIGICGKSTMDCHHTVGWMYLWAGLLGVTGLISTWLAGKTVEPVVIDDPGV